MTSGATQRLLEEIRGEFAQGRAETGCHLIERALSLNIEWESLTQAVGRGVAAGRAVWDRCGERPPTDA